MSAENIHGIPGLSDIRMTTVGIRDEFPVAEVNISLFGANRTKPHLRFLSEQVAGKICASCPLNSLQGFQVGDKKLTCGGVTFGVVQDRRESSQPEAFVISGEPMGEQEWRDLCAARSFPCEPRATFNPEDYRRG